MRAGSKMKTWAMTPTEYSSGCIAKVYHWKTKPTAVGHDTEEN